MSQVQLGVWVIVVEDHIVGDRRVSKWCGSEWVNARLNSVCGVILVLLLLHNGITCLVK